MKIGLIGFMGSGKSVVAQALSQLLGLKLLEMDHLVCQKNNVKNMQELFAKGGEQILRSTEVVVAQECVLQGNVVISTGGGVVLNPEIVALFKESGVVIVFLHVSFATILGRLVGDVSRPLFHNPKQAEALYTMRLPLYFNAAHKVIHTDSDSPEQIAQEITDGL